MTTFDIAQMTVKERLALIGELWDSLTADGVTLTLEQEAELARRMTALDDDLAWAKPYVDEALAQIERGEGRTLEEVEAHLAARFGRLSG